MKKRNLPGMILAGTLILGIWFWTVCVTEWTTASHEYLIDKYYRFESLGDVEIMQQFSPEYNRLDSIELFIANIYPETDGNICIEITNEKGKSIFKKKYPASQIPTGEFYTYKIGKKVKTGELYEICIAYDGSAEEIPQIMVSERNKNLSETGTMYVGWEESPYNMAITFHYKWRTFWGLN